jgi:integrase
MARVTVPTGGFRVAATSGERIPYVVLGPDGRRLEPVTDYLTELLAGDCSPLTLRSYAYDLLDWFRFLAAAGVRWEQVERCHVPDWVLAAKASTNPQRRRRPDQPPAGSVNQRTGKASLRDGYAAATINHRLSVVAAFYDHQRRLGRGPVTNPVPSEGPRSRRNAHHNPMEPWQPGPRGAYRQKAERRLPRAIPNRQYEELFATLTSDRDRAIVSLLVSSGARAAELLAMTGADLDWGGQRVRLIGKGSREAAWVAASPAFFRWLAAHLAGERPPLEPAGRLWVTLRAPVRPLGYQALRAVLLRANEQLGTNWTLHDFRHTCALRLASDPRIPLVDVQAHLRHRHLTTTEAYLVARPEEVIRRVQAHQRGTPPAEPSTGSGWRYDGGDLDVLFGPAAEPP